MVLGDRGLAMLKEIEDLRLVAYQDGGGVWTIGYGHTGPDVHEGQKITESQADAWLRSDVADAESAINKRIKVPLTQSMFDALVVFTFNLGAGWTRESGLLTELSNKRYLNVPEQLARWKNDNGKPVRGLLIRRLREGLLFLQDGLPR